MNLQANRVKEQMHLTMADMLRTMTFNVDNVKEATWRTEVDAILQAVAWAIRSTVSAGLKYAPVNLLFNKDMILNKKVQVTWTVIKEHREVKAQTDNSRENASRKEYQYATGKKCWIVKNKYEHNQKLDKVAEGAFKIEKVNQNGTLTINRGGYSEMIHMRHLKPFRDQNICKKNL